MTNLTHYDKQTLRSELKPYFDIISQDEGELTKERVNDRSSLAEKRNERATT